MAAPHVAGVAALLLSSRSPEDRRAERCAAAVDELVLALEESALDLAPAGRDRAAGAGLVQAEAALTRYRELVDARGGAPVCGKQDGGGGCSSGGASGAAGALGLLAAAALGRAGAQRSGRGTNRRRCQAVPSAQGE
jgi:subtilisin family serine protease